MSPNEAQLRAALHEGEGESIDAGALISHAAGVRQQRRRRIYVAAGAAAAMAVLGVGIAALTNTGGHHNSTAGGANAAANNGAHAPARPPVAAPRPNTDHGTSAAGGAAIGPDMKKSSATEKSNPPPSPAGPLSAPPPGCPQSAPRYLLPGGGGSGQFGASQPLFTHHVAKIVVCGYPAKASAGVRHLSVRGREATAVAAALESAPTTYRAGTCPGAEPAVSGKLELLATGPNGARSKPVVITVGCRTMATNGTAVRYLDSLPHRFLGLLRTSITESPVR